MTDLEAETAELTPLQQVEREHNFVFGDDGTADTTQAPAAAALVCTNPTCKNLNQHIEIHADTVLPVHCGGCNAVLHCPHNWTDIVQTTGTLAHPVQREYQHCTLCGTSTPPTDTDLPPVDLSELPVGILEHLQKTATDPPGDIRL